MFTTTKIWRTKMSQCASNWHRKPTQADFFVLKLDDDGEPVRTTYPDTEVTRFACCDLHLGRAIRTVMSGDSSVRVMIRKEP